MITKEKLENNMSHLREIVPLKPQIYTDDHPLAIKDALIKYTNKRTVNSFETCTDFYNNENWPLPLWINPFDIKIGKKNKCYYKKHFNSFGKQKFKNLKDFEYLWVPVINKIAYKIPVEKSISEAFDINIKYIQTQINQNEIISSKQIIVDEIFKSYKNDLWISAICTTLPILDYVTRKILKTKDLKITISKICKLFEEIGFSIETVDYLMPHIILIKEYSKPFWTEERKVIHEMVRNNEYGIIGSALSSFIRFSNYYYGFYREDKEEVNIINRHAILHGSVNNFGNKENTIKLITFLYLMLELKPVFDIIIDE